nr:MAG TPA: hypothetical protein [Caudoviricetes sp.]
MISSISFPFYKIKRRLKNSDALLININLAKIYYIFILS